jgi:hypothetical protein
MLIREPDLRWPIYLVAAIITALIVLMIAGVMHLALTRPAVGHPTERRLEGAIRPGMPQFEQLKEKIVVEQPEATQVSRPLNDVAVEVNATVRNTTNRTLSGLEMRAALLDRQKFSLGERTVVIVPARQTALEPGEAIKVCILLEGLSPEAERAGPLMEVAGLRFD